MKFTLILAIIASLFILPAANAGDRYGGYYNNLIVPQKVIQFDARYFLGADNYYSVGDKHRQEKQEENKTEVEYYKGQIEMLLKILANKGQLPPADNNAGGVPTPATPESNPTSPVTPDNNSNGEYEPTDTDKAVYGIIMEKCYRCHGDTAQDGGLALVKNGALQLVDLVDRVEIFDRVYGVDLHGKAKMPKGGNLTDAQVEKFRRWMVEESDRVKNSK